MIDEAVGPSSTPAKSSSFLAGCRTVAIVFVTVVYISGWLLHRAVLPARERLGASARWTHGWFRVLVRLCGITVSREGPTLDGPALYAPNHTGYLDVVALGSVLPCHFVAKADVESWPAVGFLFTSTGHLGISRKRDKKIRGVTDAMAERLGQGDRIVVFLEGTSTGGDHVLPFRSPLVQPAIDAQVPVVPVGLLWSAGRDDIDPAEDIAYWKDHVFGPHLWRFLGLTSVRVHVVFGDPVEPGGASRKELAAVVEHHVMALTGLPESKERGEGYASPIE